METLYQKLCEAVDNLPKEAVESTKKADTRKGYDTTGYQYQYLVNVLNEVLGIGGWTHNYKIVKELEGVYDKSGKNFYDITADVTVTIFLPDGTGGKIAQNFTMPGGHVSVSYSDALKGAITNGFKKALSFFSVGKKAYEGSLDDDYKPFPEDWDKAVKSSTKPQGEVKLYGLGKKDKVPLNESSHEIPHPFDSSQDVPLFPEESIGNKQNEIFNLLDKHGISGHATKLKYFKELCGLEPSESRMQDVIDNWSETFPKVLAKFGGKK